MTLRILGIFALVAVLVGCGHAAAPPAKPGATADADAADTDAASATSPEATVDSDAIAADAPTADAAADAPVSDGNAAETGEAAKCTSSAACPPPPNPCQYALCEPKVGCVFAVLADAVLCDDGKPCTANTTCSAGSCAGGMAKDCGDGNPCTVDLCDAATGTCTHLPAAATSATSSIPCDDGDACTVDSACSNGQCQGGVGICPCQTSADCAKLDDGNACNGTYYCEPASHACLLNPASVVVCPKSANACSEAQCDPKTGQCGLVAAQDGSPCSDGKACTQGDVCTQGTCTSGTNICCTGDGDCAKVDDGDLCNGTFFCNRATGNCQFNPATIVYCPTADDTACSKTACDPKLGKCAKVTAQDGAACDDGNPCTQDSCVGGACKPGVSTCACSSDSDCQKFEDGNLCNGTLFCHKASNQCKVNPASIVQCPAWQNGPCAASVCNPKSGTCALVAQNDGASCDADGNPCTAGDSCKSGNCVAGIVACGCQTNADCQAQEDGNLCNGTLYCDQIAKACKVNPATVVACPTAGDTACSHNACVPATGQCQIAAVNELGACEADGNPCTASDTCVQGQCVASPDACQCKSDGDCAALDDGNLCNGSLYCDKGSGICKVNPATVVNCPTAGDTACSHNVCAPKTGLCSVVPFNSLGPCDGDGNPCTLGDRCVAGQCVLGNNVCQCGTDQSCGIFDDDNLCNGQLACNGQIVAGFVGLCVPATATIVACGGGSACAGSVCAPKTGKCGLTAINEGKGCDDGLACTGGDQCQGGVCVGTQPGCDDGEPCTADTCDAAAGKCVHAPLVCTDDNACTADSCIAGGGCLFKNQNGNCDDGNLCTLGDACQNGACLPGSQTQSCDDGAVCTLDACSPASGCVHSAVSGPCSDANPCTIGDSCSAGACVGAGALDCGDGNPCTSDVCKTGLGCIHLAQSATCTDSNPCTTGDGCAGGVCKGSSEVDCTDGNPCTADSCAPGKGCVHAAQNVSCDDNNPCTAGDGCQNGACLPGAATVSCDDGSVCTLDACSTLSGCVHSAISGGCSDDNTCTTGDTCQQGTCLGTGIANCNDANPCTADSCVPSVGCILLPQTATCSDGNPCTLGDKCAGGACKSGALVPCDDSDLCTDDACSPTKGCVHAYNSGGCNDGLFCTVADTCDGKGNCLGNARDCQSEVGGPCAGAKCDEANSQCVALQFADGTGCDDGIDCTPLDLCSKGKCVGSGNVCSDEQVNLAGQANGGSSIVATPGGGYAVQWNSAGFQVRVRRTDGNGCKAGDEIRLDNGNSTGQSAPRLAVNPDGTLYAGWWNGGASGKCGGLNEPTPDGKPIFSRIFADGTVASTEAFNYAEEMGLCLANYANWGPVQVRSVPIFQAGTPYALSAMAMANGEQTPLVPKIAAFPMGALKGAGSGALTASTTLVNFDHCIGNESPTTGYVATVEGKDGNGWNAVMHQYTAAPTSLNGPTWNFADKPLFATMPTILRMHPRLGGGIWALLAGKAQDGKSNDVFLYSVNVNGSSTRIAIAALDDDEGPADFDVFADGGLVVVWQTPAGDGSGQAVLARTYDKQGAALGDSFVVPSNTFGDQLDPAVAVLANDDFVVTFRDTAGKLYARRFSKDGKIAGGHVEHIANTATEGDQNQLAVAAQPDGSRAMLVWSGPVAGKDGLEVRARVVDGNGKPVSAEIVVNTTSADNQSQPKVAGNANRFVVIWDSFGQDGAQDAVFGRVFDQNGVPQTGEIAVIQTSGGGQVPAAVGMGQTGQWLAISVHDYTSLRLRGFDKTGTALGTQDEVQLFDGGGYGTIQLLAIPNSTQFVQFWDHSGFNVWDIWLVHRTQTGQATGNVVQVSPSFDQRKVAVAGNTTTGTMCYQDSTAAKWRIICRTVDYETLVAGPTQVMDTVASDNATLPAIAAIAGGQFAAAWQAENADGDGLGIQMAKLDPAAAPAGPRVQANRTAAGNQEAPVLAWLKGGMLAAWVAEGQDGSGKGIVYRVLP